MDVREDFEFSTSRIPGFKLMPLSRFSEWSGDITARLDPSKETVVLCHHGVRSMQMAQVGVAAGARQGRGGAVCSCCAARSRQEAAPRACARGALDGWQRSGCLTQELRGHVNSYSG